MKTLGATGSAARALPADFLVATLKANVNNLSNKMSTPPQDLYLVDGHSQLYRAFYAIRRLSNSAGLPTNMLFGFVQMLNRLFKDFEPVRLAVLFDTPGPTFRHELYAAYKANRPPPPEDFITQLPYIKRLLAAYGIPLLERSGFEADDLIATLASRQRDAGGRAFIITSDKDLFQLVDERIKVLSAKGDQTIVYDRERVKEKMGVWPEQVLDLLGLMGDSVDNIPGIPGVGPKTAVKLLQEFGDLDNVLARASELKSGKQREKIIANKEQALLSRKLAELICDVPIAQAPEDLERRPEDRQELAQLFAELEFRNYQQRYPLEQEPAPAAPQPASPAQEETPREYTTVTREDELIAWSERLKGAELLAFDTETDSLNAQCAELVGISLSNRPGQAIYIPVGHATLAAVQLPLKRVREIIGPLLADPETPKTAQNAKYDLTVLGRHGFEVRGLVFDTMVAAYLLDPDASHGLKKMSRKHLGITMTEISELIGSGKKQISMRDVMIEDAADYACQDADVTLRLTNLLRGQLEEQGLSSLFHEMELPLVGVLERMEREGVTIDVEYFAQLAKEFAGELEALVKQIYEISGRQFLINSPKQVAEILFNELQLPTGGVKRGKSGALSTDVTVLEMLSNIHPLPKLLLEYRKFEKLKNTYVDPLPILRHPQTGRIHTSYNQTVTSTGRLSSSRPNLQNIPVRTRHGRAIRQGFIPSAPNRVLLAADYSQIELRVLAHVTGDESLVKAFREELDIHNLTASRVFGLDADAVTAEMRAQAKVVNFGIIYGMSAHRLAGELGLTRTKAQQFINEYFAAYPGVKNWIAQIIEQAKEKGYVETLLRRRRYVPEINSHNHNVRSAAERIAVNMPIQGASADMIKLAMIGIDGELRKRKCGAKMIMQVHDELIFDMPQEEVEELTPVIKRIMEEALPLDVPVVVDVKTGPNWAEC